MTDKEIIKALKEEVYRAEYVDNDYVDCVSLKLLKITLDLINRQQVEIDGLQRFVSLSIDTQNEFSDTITKQKSEIKRLKEENNSLNANIKNLKQSLEAQRFANNRFAERLKGLSRWTVSDKFWIDKLVEEMIGENND